MLSPAPSQTQEPPSNQVIQEPQKVKSTLAKRRAGQTPTALFVKALLRPIFKGIYYLLQGIRTHRWLTLLLLVLFLGASTFGTYWVTGSLPFGIGHDSFDFHLRCSDVSLTAPVHCSDGGGEQVKNWLYSVRQGDGASLQSIQQGLVMQQPPDINQLVSTYSQKQITWKSITVIGVYSEPDTTVDSFIEVDYAGQGPSGGSNSGVMIWHFTTLPQQQGRMLTIDRVAFRPLLTAGQ